MELAPDGSTLPLSYNFDDTHSITLEPYLNGPFSANDCVIAARAHHTVRLDYFDGSSIDISDPEIQTEYTKEAGPFNLGIVLSDSLQSWRDDGWQAGGKWRQIQQFNGPFNLDGSGALSGDATSDVDLDQLRSYIIQYTGAQVDLNLPDGITVNNSVTFGPGHDWKDTSKNPSENNRHTMLLIGYDPAGFIGITWGAKQYMTLTFLQKYCVSVYWILKRSSA